ncbi:MAG: alpha/beta hydrolase [Pseudomonadota bacterium]
MTDSNSLRKDTVALEIEGVKLRIEVMRRDGRRAPLVFLHGFGSTKEDYADLAGQPQFDGRPIVAFDAPGCGESHSDDLSALSIPFLRQTAEGVLRHYEIEVCHLIGHSMGGLTALMLAGESPHQVLSFTDIEGNLAPEDCFLSRQAFDHPADDPEAFMDAFAERAWHSPTLSHPLFAAAVRQKVRPEAVGPILRSMVDCSENGRLMARFTGLPCPRMFVYGEQNRTLSYLGTLLRQGVQLAEIERAGHWPMYANPQALWTRLGQFVEQSEMAAAA